MDKALSYRIAIGGSLFAFLDVRYFLFNGKRQRSTQNIQLEQPTEKLQTKVQQTLTEANPMK